MPILENGEERAEGSALVEMDEDYLGLKLRTLVTKHYRLTVYSGQSYGELFDLRADPDEVQNRWADPNYRSVREELRGRLLDKIMETDCSLPRQRCRA